MFEHLDDEHAPPAIDRSAVERSGRRKRRRRFAARAATGTFAAAIVVVAGVALYVDRRDAAIDRVDIAAPPQAATDGVTNVLLVGVDDDLGAGARADALIVVRLEADGYTRMLSIPRDLVDALGGERINVRAGDGPAAAAAAVTAYTGIPVDHVVQLDFDGFVALVDAVGGVSVAIDRPIVDPRTGTDLRPTSCTTLDGLTALGLVRARAVEGDASGDLGRQARQRALLAAALAQTGASDIDAVSRVLADHAVVDSGLDLDRLLDLGRRLDATSELDAMSLPTVAAIAPGGAQVLVLGPGAASVVHEFGSALPVDELLPAGGQGVETADAGIGPCA